MTDLGIAGVGDATLIASGGSALVYEALSGAGEPLAVKVLRGIRGDEVTRRFDRELSAAERLSGHPNIIRIHHTGLTGAGEPYLVMPLYRDGSLHDELQAIGAFDRNQAVNDVIMATNAIEFAHSRGVLHRDIKPANLLRSSDGSVVVTDFGIARVTDAGITSATVGATTPLYAAPELLAENEVSIQSEVYSLGALLYTLLAGAPAFSDTDNIWATMNRIRSEAPPPIAGVPLPVMRVIEQAMAKEPSQRPATAGLFRTYLQHAMQADDSWWPPAQNGTVEFPRDRADSAVSSTQPVRQGAPGAVAPPAPALNRPAPTVRRSVRQPLLERPAIKVLASLTALVLIAGLAWLATTALLRSNQISDTAAEPPVDNSLPSPTAAPGTDSSADDEPTSAPDPVATPPTRLVSFTGDHFSAFLPEGWSLLRKDNVETYGFRSEFVSESMYLNIDTTPSEQRTPGGDIAQSAREIAASINSASAVTSEEIDGLLMHSFTFRNRQGVDSIDIFFEVDGDGYAIVAGSQTEPQAAFATARRVALSIRSNPDQ